MIKSENLFRLQSKITRKNKTIRVVSLEEDYILTWILIGISRTEASSLFAFKGGTSLRKVYTLIHLTPIFNILTEKGSL
jgi:predicted nucleotidyltransferase component of viral defense system